MTEILLSSSLLILALALLRRLLRGRIDPRLQYGLWLLVALRLLIPGTLFTMPVSIAGAAENLRESVSLALQEQTSPSSDTQTDGSVSPPLPEEDTLPSALPEENAVSSADSQADSGSSASLQSGTDPSSQETTGSVSSQAESSTSSVQRFSSLLSPLYDLYDRYTETAEYPLGTSQEQLNQDILDQGYFISGYHVDLESGRQIVTYSEYSSLWDMPFWRWPWYCGIALMGCILLGANLRFAYTLRKKRQLVPQESLPASCRMPVYLVEDLSSPCLFGLVRPAIYINRQALVPGRLDHILAHEQAHYRHGDHLWALLRALCLAVYWFNPLVWWAAILSRRDSELACDHSAIQRLGEDQRLNYGRTLVDMIVPGRHLSGLLRTATTMTEKKRTMKERILLIAKKPQMAIATLVLVLMGTVVAVLLTFGGTQSGTTGSSGAPVSLSSLTAPDENTFLNHRDNVYTFLLAGLDDTSGTTDTLLLATYDAENGELNFLSIPRDTAVDVPWETKRISSVYSSSLSGGGIDCLMQQVQGLTGIYPDYYFVADADTVAQVVDALGGVWFDVPFAMDYDDPYQDLHIHQEEGYRLLSGEDAAEIIRWRRNNDGSNLGGNDLTDRIPLQQSFFQAVIEQSLEVEEWSQIMELAGVLAENVTTDLPASHLLWFARQAMDIDVENISFHTLPGTFSTVRASEDSGLQTVFLSSPDETAELVNESFNPYTYSILSSSLYRMTVDENGILIRELSSWASPYTLLSSTNYIHSREFFSLTLPEDWVGAVAYAETEDGVSFYEADTFQAYQQGATTATGLLLTIQPQPADYAAPGSYTVLDTFDLNGTPHVYQAVKAQEKDVLPGQEDVYDQLLAQADQVDFHLLVTEELICRLIHDSYESDMAAAIPYLPYLSWNSYRSIYGDRELEALLFALSDYTLGGKADWGQVHDILSAPVDEAIDGAYATAYQDILVGLYQTDLTTFISVIKSSYISDAERDNVVYWLRSPMAEELGRSEPLSDEEVRVVLGLSDGSVGGDATSGESLPSMSGEMMNGFMRGWAPGVTSLGDTYPVKTSVRDDWSLDAIAQAIQASLEQSLAGTSWAGQLTDVTISYTFSLPEDVKSGDTLEIPYYATLSTVYTVDGYAPEHFSLSGGPFTARVTLSGDGSLTASQDFLERQAVYHQLKSSFQSISLEAVSGSDFDLGNAVWDVLEARLEAAGLAEDYRITSFGLDSYTQPASLSPGTVQTINVTVDCAPIDEDGILIPKISFPITCTTVAE